MSTVLPDGTRIFPPSTNVSAHTFFANTNPAPRVGVTYDITGKSEWIIRGGGGVFYDRSQGNSVFDLLRNPPTTLEPVFNNGRLQDVNPNTVLLAPPGLVAYEHSGKIPTTYAFNLGVQMKLPGASVLDISYVGAINRMLIRARLARRGAAPGAA